jgi:hypothetical protein
MPSHVHKEMLLDTWVSQTGVQIKIKDLSTDHLLNIVALLYCRGGKDNPQRMKLVTLEKEVVKRLGGLHNAS